MSVLEYEIKLQANPTRLDRVLRYICPKTVAVAVITGLAVHLLERHPSLAPALDTAADLASEVSALF